MDQLKEYYKALLKTADLLIVRSSGLRRRSGSSPAERILYPCLPLLRGLGDFLTAEDRKQLQQMEEALWERLLALRKQRIPLSPLVHRFHRQCRKFLRALPKVPEHWDSPQVLVGTLRTPEQLDICQEFGFYHVPASQIPEDWVSCPYVAIYQSRTLFPDDCGIYFYGKVKSCTPVRRWKIFEIPKASDDLYYRLDVEYWQQLDLPVTVRELPITHLLTNLFLLQHSMETPELTLKTPRHYLFYQAIGRALELGNGTIFRYKGGSVQLKDKLLQIRRHGRMIASFLVEDFVRTPADIFSQMMDILARKA